MNQLVDGTGVFPGEAKQLDPASGGKWIIAFQQDDAFLLSSVAVMEGGSILNQFTMPIFLSDTAYHAFDPGVVRLQNGLWAITWHRDSMFFAKIRYGPADYGPILLTADLRKGGQAEEQTAARIRSKAYQVLNFRPDERGLDGAFDLQLWRLTSGLVDSYQVSTIAENATGWGTQGKQTRATIASNGINKGMICVWSQNAGKGNPRSVWAADSTDDGLSWGNHRRIAQRVDSSGEHDLVNPYVLKYSTADLRVFFSQDRHVPPIGYIKSTDHGATWSDINDVVVPDTATSARIVVAKQAEKGQPPVLVVSTKDIQGDKFTGLGTFEAIDE